MASAIKTAHGGHPVNLGACFLALLVLTAGEVGLYELWHYTDLHGEPFVPKFVIVLMILVLTLPKAAIVMIYFMHLKFERSFVVLLALLPLLLVGICVLPTLTDIRTLAGREMTYNQVEFVGASHGGHGPAAGHGAAGHGPAALPAAHGPATIQGPDSTGSTVSTAPSSASDSGFDGDSGFGGSGFNGDSGFGASSGFDAGSGFGSEPPAAPAETAGEAAEEPEAPQVQTPAGAAPDSGFDPDSGF